MNFKAIIFDLDGTLLDTLQDLALSVNAVLREKGLAEHSIDAYRYFVGDGIEQLVLRAFPAGSEHLDQLPLLVDQVKAEYRRRWADHTRPYPGIAELLDFLEGRKIPKAILTNKPQEFALVTVNTLLSGWTFKPVLGVSSSIFPKPDPQGALQVAGLLKQKPGDLLYLGDTDTDMKTAKAAGMFPVGALWGFRPAEELKKAGAVILVESPLELRKYFGGDCDGG